MVDDKPDIQIMHVTLQAQNDAENEKRVTHLMNYFDRPLYNRNRRYVIQVDSQTVMSQAIR